MILDHEKKIHYVTTAQAVLDIFETLAASQYFTRIARKGEKATIVLKCTGITLWVDTPRNSDLYKMLYKNGFQVQISSQMQPLLDGLYGLVEQEASVIAKS